MSPLIGMTVSWPTQTGRMPITQAGSGTVQHVYNHGECAWLLILPADGRLIEVRAAACRVDLPTTPTFTRAK